MSIREIFDLRRYRDRLFAAAAVPLAVEAPPPAEDAAAAAPTAPSVTSDTALDDIAKWLATGLALASGLLTAIGIKEGQLDRILRNEAPPALFVFSLIALAVVFGVIAPAVNEGVPMRVGVVLIAMALGPIIAVPVLPDLVPGWTTSRSALTILIAATLVVVVIVFGTALSQNTKGTYVAGLVAVWVNQWNQLTDHTAGTSLSRTIAIDVSIIAIVVVASFATWQRQTTLKLGVIAIGIALFATGTFGAMKLAVESKTVKDRPFLTATLAVKDGLPVVSVHFKGAGMRSDEHMAATVRAYSDAITDQDSIDDCGKGCVLLQGLRSGPDSTGLVDATFDVPVPTAVFKFVAVRAFICGQQDPKDPDRCEDIVGKIAFADIQLASIAIGPSAVVTWPTIDQVRAEAAIQIVTSDLTRADVIHVVVLQQDGAAAPTTVATATLPASSTGAVDRTIPVFLARPVTRMCVLAGRELPKDNLTCDPSDDYTVVALPVPPAPPPA